jgi:hypothetical protein
MSKPLWSAEKIVSVANNPEAWAGAIEDAWYCYNRRPEKEMQAADPNRQVYNNLLQRLWVWRGYDPRN